MAIPTIVTHVRLIIPTTATAMGSVKAQISAMGAMTTSIPMPMVWPTLVMFVKDLPTGPILTKTVFPMGAMYVRNLPPVTVMATGCAMKRTSAMVSMTPSIPTETVIRTAVIYVPKNFPTIQMVMAFATASTPARDSLTLEDADGDGVGRRL